MALPSGMKSGMFLGSYESMVIGSKIVYSS